MRASLKMFRAPVIMLIAYILFLLGISYFMYPIARGQLTQETAQATLRGQTAADINGYNLTCRVKVKGAILFTYSAQAGGGAKLILAEKSPVLPRYRVRRLPAIEYGEIIEQGDVFHELLIRRDGEGFQVTARFQLIGRSASFFAGWLIIFAQFFYAFHKYRQQKAKANMPESGTPAPQ